MPRVTAGIAQCRAPREHDARAVAVRAKRVAARTPRIHRSTDRNVVSDHLDSAARDNLTGKNEGTIDGEMSADEEDTLPDPSVDREVAIADDYWRARRTN